MEHVQKERKKIVWSDLEAVQSKLAFQDLLL